MNHRQSAWMQFEAAPIEHRQEFCHQLALPRYRPAPVPKPKIQDDILEYVDSTYTADVLCIRVGYLFDIWVLFSTLRKLTGSCSFTRNLVDVSLMTPFPIQGVNRQSVFDINHKKLTIRISTSRHLS